MNFLPQLIPVVVALGFFFAPADYAAGAPGAGATVALLLWFLSPQEPPRFGAWAAVAAGAFVLVSKGAGALGAAVAVPITIYIILEVVGNKSKSKAAPSLLVLALMIVVAVSGYTTARKGDPYKPLGQFRRVVVIGDSLSAGVSGDGVNTRWPSILGNVLQAEVINLSQSGDTADEAYRRWEDRISQSAWNPDNAAWQPDLIILEVGGNDIRSSRNADALVQDLKKWLDLLQRHNAQILMVAVPGGLITDSYSDVWKKASEGREGVAVMPQTTLRSIFGSTRYTLPDRIHFNQAGHQHFAESVAARIRGE